MAEPETPKETKQELAKREERPMAKAGFAVLPQTYEQLWAYAKEICLTEFTPKSFRGSAGAVLAAWQKGSEVGLPPMASLESICVINGVTSIHSDGFWALVISSPLCESFEELGPAECIEKGYGECTIKRRGNPKPITRRFTLDMAKSADLLGKDNWRKYPGRMLQQRARHLASDDSIPEATQGLVPSDVASDYTEPRDVTPAPEPIKTPQALRAQPKEQDNDPKPTGDSTGVRVQQATGMRVGKDPRRSKNTEPASVPTEKQEAQAEQSQEDIMAECLLWVESCSNEELTSSDPWVFKALKGVKGTENQLAVLRPFNERRQKLLMGAKA